MKGQATVEFLFIFLASILVCSVIGSALLLQYETAQERKGDLERVYISESVARAEETWLNSGIEMKFDFHKENVSRHVEGDTFRVNYKGKIIEVEGVFEYDDSEPL